jgi:hypothetical protein
VGKARKRSLSTLPGWDEASNELAACDRAFNKSVLRSLGEWVPPASINEVTVVLLRALALGVIRQQSLIDARAKLNEPTANIADARAICHGQRVVSLREIYRDRARGKFGPEWFMSEHNGGDPTL